MKDGIGDAGALVRDLELMPNGDATAVGERGSALSGGQRARICLARALYYQEAKLFLLDDVLSAVDNSVGNQLFHRGIRGMLKDKAVVLVTHQLQFLRWADQVVLLEEGKMSYCGSYDGLLVQALPFVEMLSKYDSLKAMEGNCQGQQEQADKQLEQLMIENVEQQKQASMPKGTDCPAETPSFQDKQASEGEEEERHQGSVGLSVYVRFFRQGGSLWILGAIFLCALAAQASLLAFMEVSQEWSEHLSSHKWLGWSCGLAGAEIILFALVFHGFYRLAQRCAKKLFKRVLLRVMHAPLAFFQVNPAGRILNRFSKDQSVVDESLYGNMSDCIFSLVRNLCCFGMVLRCNWLSVFLLPPLVLLLWYFRRRYFRVSRELKRLESVSRSPVYSLLSVTLEGLPTIRCFGCQQAFAGKFARLQDTNTAAMFAFLGASRWFIFAVEFSCSLFYIAYMFFVCALVAIANRSSGTGSLLAGIQAAALANAIYCCQEISESIPWTARQLAEVENNMTSVERLTAYLDIASEAASHTGADADLPVGWPASGNISFRQMTLAYAGRAKPALRDISCNFEPGEKIALVGRTGAGKSSFLSALFRIVEVQAGGCISIDGVDIGALGLTTLRHRISIIPQEPFLFRGDIRFNLDPFANHTDTELWTALAAVELAGKVSRMPGQLSAAVLENGSNFSAGQKQLVCLARAILRRNKVIVMDEATANIDLCTSQKIQTAIKTIFSQHNVCTIAHRLHTVIDYDRIVVLEAGQIAEMGSPHDLLCNPAGKFTEMVRKLGATGEAYLKRMALDRHLEKQQHLRDLSHSHLAL